MKAAIFYFSESGNTEEVAIAIYEKLAKAGYEVEPVRFQDLADLPAAVDGIDLFGVGFPVFFGYPPKFITEALESLKRTKGTDAFVFTTYGGATAGDALFEAASVLKKRGYRVLGGLKLEGSDDYPQGRALGINKGRPDGHDLAAAREFTDLILKAKAARKQLDPKKLASTTPFFVRSRDRPRSEVLEEIRSHVEGKIEYDQTQCIYCATCMGSCPTKSIKRGIKLPEFSWKCIDGVRCYQCVRVCPGKALTVQFPGPPEEYRKYWATIADSPEEKKRLYVVAE